MKRSVRIILKVFILVLIGIPGYTQQDEPVRVSASPRMISEKGYWIIVSNVRNPDHHIVYFYSNDHKLVFKDDLVRMKVDLNNRKFLHKMKVALELALEGYRSDAEINENQQLLKKMLE